VVVDVDVVVVVDLDFDFAVDLPPSTVPHHPLDWTPRRYLGCIR